MAAVNTRTARASRPRADGAAPVPDAVLTDAVATADAYVAHMKSSALSPGTARVYASHVRAFATWLTASDHHDVLAAFTDPHARDYAVRDHRDWLINEPAANGTRRSASTIDGRLAALEGFYAWLGLGSPTVKRVSTAGFSDGFGDHLTNPQTKAVLRAAERRGPRDLAVLGILRFAGLRIAEAAALNVDDIAITQRTGRVQVRGKGSKMREVPLNSFGQRAIEPWLVERRSQLRDTVGFGPLFVNAAGERLAIRTLRYVVTEVGKTARVDLHPHLLRHTFAHGHIADGTHPTTLRMYLGHSSLATTMIYTGPTRVEYDAAAENGGVDW